MIHVAPIGGQEARRCPVPRTPLRLSYRNPHRDLQHQPPRLSPRQPNRTPPRKTPPRKTPPRPPSRKPKRNPISEPRTEEVSFFGQRLPRLANPSRPSSRKLRNAPRYGNPEADLVPEAPYRTSLRKPRSGPRNGSLGARPQPPTVTFCVTLTASKTRSAYRLPPRGSSWLPDRAGVS